jgi:hypothetical protein
MRSKEVNKMKTEGATYKYVTLEEATNIMFQALSSWKITYHYRHPERAELNLKNLENGDVMEIRFRNGKLDDVSIYTDEDIVVYTVRED